jgi:hypothetical protein
MRVLAACLLLGALVPAARADWARDYDLGVRAIEGGDWAEAERRMRAALAEEPEDMPRKRFQGQRYDRYVPHWYAGLAAFRQGDCARALEYWSDAAGRRVVAGIGELAAEQKRLGGECETRLAAAAKPQPAPATAAPPTAPERRAATAAPAPETVARQPAPAAREPERTAARTQPAREPPAASRAARTEAPAALRSGLEDWLAGRYDQLARMDVPQGMEARARAQLLLLRAAAHFIVAELSGTEARLESARADVRAARAAGMPNLDAALYPPRFRQFAGTTR